MQNKRKNLEELLLSFSLHSATKKDFEKYISILHTSSNTIINQYFQKLERFVTNNYNDDFGDYTKSVLEKDDLELLQVFELLYSNSLDIMTYLEKYYFKVGISKLHPMELSILNKRISELENIHSQNQISIKLLFYLLLIYLFKENKLIDIQNDVGDMIDLLFSNETLLCKSIKTIIFQNPKTVELLNLPDKSIIFRQLAKVGVSDNEKEKEMLYYTQILELFLRDTDNPSIENVLKSLNYYNNNYALGFQMLLNHDSSIPVHSYLEIQYSFHGSMSM